MKLVPQQELANILLDSFSIAPMIEEPALNNQDHHC